MSNLHLVASLMDNFLRTENYSLTTMLKSYALTIRELLTKVQVLETQARVLRQELHDADGIIFESNVRNWDLVGQNDLLRVTIADLEYQLNGSPISSPATTVRESSSDTESEGLFNPEDQEV